MCDDIDRFRADVAARGLACGEVNDQRWGRVVTI